MKKNYISPDLELIRFSFESILDGGDPGEGHGLVHSIGESGVVSGDEGLD